ncbi:hypothetical protein D6C93_02478 [Aureobasidium pullulans]|nr:hypothetical protein D6C93_02478 [Aureobasidium pullulans]
MASRPPDGVSHPQEIADPYDSPTEANFEEVRRVYALTSWIRDHPDEAPNVLGKNNARLSKPEARLTIWPPGVRHTDSQLRAIWKFCNPLCWQLAPYAFRSGLRPYDEFSWVMHATRKRFPSNRNTVPRPAINTQPQHPPTSTIVRGIDTSASSSTVVDLTPTAGSQNHQSLPPAPAAQPPATTSSITLPTPVIQRRTTLPRDTASDTRQCVSRPASISASSATSNVPSYLSLPSTPTPTPRENAQHTPSQFAHLTFPQSSITVDSAPPQRPYQHSSCASSHPGIPRSGRPFLPPFPLPPGPWNPSMWNGNLPFLPPPPPPPHLWASLLRNVNLPPPPPPPLASAPLNTTPNAAYLQQRPRHTSDHPSSPTVTQTRPYDSGSYTMPVRSFDQLMAGNDRRDGFRRDKTSHEQSHSPRPTGTALSTPQSLHIETKPLRELETPLLPAFRNAAVLAASFSRPTVDTIDADTKRDLKVSTSRGDAGESEHHQKGKGRADLIDKSTPCAILISGNIPPVVAENTPASQSPANSRLSSNLTTRIPGLNFADREMQTSGQSKAFGKQPLKGTITSNAATFPPSLPTERQNKSAARDCKSCNRKHAGDCIPAYASLAPSVLTDMSALAIIAKSATVDTFNNVESVTTARAGTWLFSSSLGRPDALPVKETLKARQQPDALVEIAAKPDKKPRAPTKALENNHIPTRTDPTTPADANDANDAKIIICCKTCDKHHEQNRQPCGCGKCHIFKEGNPRNMCDDCDKCHRRGKCTEKGKDVRAEKKRKAEEEDVKPAVLPDRSGLADRPKKKSRKSSSVGTKGDPIQLDSE